MTEKPAWWSSDEWETPPEFFDLINRQLGPFTLDPCARAETAKCEQYFTQEDDGLAQPWYGVVWVNPPYSAPRRWVEKALAEMAAGHANRIVMLLPAAVDTVWFHDLVLPHAEVYFIRGRLRFLGWEGTPIGSPTAGNVLAVFRPKGWCDAYPSKIAKEPTHG
jgi:phage N-6-adenine-methyltransferase